jgi:hypothetical protein
MRKKPRTLDEEIAESLRQSHESGELRRARDWGKPLDFGDGYDETPPELRMGFKILKDAGVVPAEIEVLREIERLEKRLGALDPGSDEAAALREKISGMRLVVAVRLEAMAKR